MTKEHRLRIYILCSDFQIKRVANCTTVKMTEFQYIKGDVLYLPDRRYGARHNPNAIVRFRRTDYEEIIRINNCGMRVSDAVAPPTPQAGTIMLAGDSWTFGDGVNYDDSFVGRLSRLLPWPVLNIGACSYNMLQVINASLDFAKRFPPQLLVICYASKMIRRLFVSEAYGGLIHRPTLISYNGGCRVRYPRQLPRFYVRGYAVLTHQMYSMSGLRRSMGLFLATLFHTLGRTYLTSSCRKVWCRQPVPRNMAMTYCAELLAQCAEALNLHVLLHGMCEIDAMTESANQTLADIEWFDNWFATVGVRRVMCIYGAEEEKFYRAHHAGVTWDDVRRRFIDPKTNHPTPDAHSAIANSLKGSIERALAGKCAEQV